MKLCRLRGQSSPFPRVEFLTDPLTGPSLPVGSGEALETISVDWPALIFAGVFAIGLGLFLRARRVGVIAIGVMMLLQVVFWPSYSRDTTADWIVQTAFLVLGVVGVVSAGGVIWKSRASRTT